MDDRKIRIGILGAGAMATMHAAAYAGMPDVQIVGVFGRDIERARAAAALCNAEACTEATALIRHADVDAIDVCLPTALHHDFVIPALDMGKHVFCETPLAVRLDEARHMRAAAYRNDRLLQVGLLMRSVGAYQHIKDVASSGECGRLSSLTAYRLGSYLAPGSPDRKTHYGDPSTELMTFDFDFAQWVMGRPARLSAGATRLADGTPAEITALLHYDDGRHAAIVGSASMPHGFPFSVGFRAVFEQAAFVLRTVFEGGPPRNDFVVFKGDGTSETVSTLERNPYEVELKRFVDCIRGGADPALLDAERAIEALMLSIATQRSLEEGRSIEIDTVP